MYVCAHAFYIHTMSACIYGEHTWKYLCAVLCLVIKINLDKQVVGGAMGISYRPRH